MDRDLDEALFCCFVVYSCVHLGSSVTYLQVVELHAGAENVIIEHQ